MKVFINSTEEDEERDPLLGRDRLASDPPISLWRKVLFIFGGCGRTSANFVINSYITIFLLEIAHIQPILVSLILLVSKCFSAFSDPLIGYFVSNSYSVRCGRARPWMLVATPSMAVTYYFLWMSIASWTTVTRVVYYCIVYWMYSFSNAMFYIPFVSSTLAISNSQSQRDELTAYRMTGEAIGAVFGPAIQAVVIFIGHTNGWDEPKIYQVAASCLSLVLLICGTVSIICVHERHVIPMHPLGDSFFQYYRSLITFKPYTILLLCFMFLSVGYAVSTGLMLLYLKYCWKVPESFGPLLIVILFTTAALSVPLWQKILPWAGKTTTFSMGTIPIMAVFLSMLFLQYNIYVSIAVPVLIGFLLGCSMLVPQSMIQDAIAAYSLTHSHGSAEGFYTLSFFLDVLAAAICNAIATAVLQIAGYDSNLPASGQPASVSLSLRLIIGTFPVLCFLVSLILMCEYPIKETDRKKMNQMIKRNLSTPSPLYREPTSPNKLKDSNETGKITYSLCVPVFE